MSAPATTGEINQLLDKLQDVGFDMHFSIEVHKMIFRQFIENYEYYPLDFILVSLQRVAIFVNLSSNHIGEWRLDSNHKLSIYPKESEGKWCASPKDAVIDYLKPFLQVANQAIQSN